MTSEQAWKAGDGVTFTSYGQPYRGTIVEAPKNGVAIVRVHETGRRTWKHLESLTRVTPE